MSLYQIKPAFQSMLRPSVGTLHRIGVTANQVTMTAYLVSPAIGLGLYFFAPGPAWGFTLITHTFTGERE